MFKSKDNELEVKWLRSVYSDLESRVDQLVELIGTHNNVVVRTKYLDQLRPVMPVELEDTIVGELRNLNEKLEKLTAIVNEVVDHVYREES